MKIKLIWSFLHKARAKPVSQGVGNYSIIYYESVMSQ